MFTNAQVALQAAVAMHAPSSVGESAIKATADSYLRWLDQRAPDQPAPAPIPHRDPNLQYPG